MTLSDLNPQTWLARIGAGLLLLVLTVGGGFWWGHHVAAFACQAKQAQATLKTNQAAQQKSDKGNNVLQAAGTKQAQAEAKAQIVYRTIYRDVNHYIETHPDQPSCDLGSDGLRALDAAIEGTDANPPAQPDGQVPEGTAAGGRQAVNAAQE